MDSISLAILAIGSLIGQFNPVLRTDNEISERLMKVAIFEDIFHKQIIYFRSNIHSDIDST